MVITTGHPQIPNFLSVEAPFRFVQGCVVDLDTEMLAEVCNVLQALAVGAVADAAKDAIGKSMF